MKGGYVEGFVFTVPKKKTALYKKMAGAMAELSRKYGALDYKECRAVNLKPKVMSGMTYLPFPKMVKPKKDEAIWFSYIVYKSRKDREAIVKKMMQDPMMKNPPEEWKNAPMPFDMKRMAMAGFQVEVSM